MNGNFSETNLNLAVAESVYASENVSFEELLNQIFKENVETISITLKNLIQKQFVAQLKNLIRHLGKKHIFEKIKNGSSESINNFDEAFKKKNLTGLFFDDSNLEKKVKILMEMKSEDNLITEFQQYFQRLKNRFALIKNEENFQIQLEEWLKSGEMTIQIWDRLNFWYKNGALLSTFKSLNIPKRTNRDSYYFKTVNAAKKIITNEFLEQKNVEKILKEFFKELCWKFEGNKLIISGRSIYLSKENEKLQLKLEKHMASEKIKIEQVEFYAEDCFHLDCDVELSGINFCVIGNMAYIWEKRTINLSGKDFQPNKSKARNASNLDEKGQDGKDGKAGQSSGNLAILVKKMVNPSDLTVSLVGGRGEDGQDGGDGFDGPNGIGIKKDEFDELCVKYNSLYWNSWKTFKEYEPPNNWKKEISLFEKNNFFVYQTYIEEDSGRKIEFSYAGFKNHWYKERKYDLYFAIFGSNGKKGTQGGSNGVGGEGGYFGNAKIENLETDERFPVNIISKLGENGTNGIIGKSGKNGINGNDMVVINRSDIGMRKFYYGDENTKIVCKFQYKKEEYNRFSGFLKHVKKMSACFIEFSTSEIDKSVVVAKIANKRTEKTSHSKAVANQSIISEELLSKAEGFFGNESFVSTHVCEEKISAEEVEDEQETITEEIIILKPKNEEKIKNFTPENEKKNRPKFTVDSLAERISKTGRNATNSVSFQNMDLFSIEIPYNQLEKIKFCTLFQKNYTLHAIKDSKFKCAVLAAQQDLLQNGKTYSEIVNFADNLTIRRRQKYEFSKFSNEISKMMEKFETVNCKILEKSYETDQILTGVKQKPLKFDEINFIDEFFENFTKFEANLQMLKIFNDFLQKIDNELKKLLDTLCNNIEDDEEFKKHLKKISLWKKEQINAQKLEERNSSHAKVSSSRTPNYLESTFSNLVENISENSNFWNPIFESMEPCFDEFKERYGTIPQSLKQTKNDFAKNNIKKLVQFFSNEKNHEIKKAKFILKIYKDAEPCLIFNRHLYYLNWLMKIDQGKEIFKNAFVDNGIPKNFEAFLKQFTNHELDLENVDCQDYMKKYGLGCAPTRYLFAHERKKRIISFVKNGHQQLKKIEEFNVQNAENTIIFWIDDKKAFGIEPDQDYRDLIQAIKKCDENYSENFKNEMKKYENDNFYSSENLNQISSYFDKDYQSVIKEWIENFLAIAKNQTLLNILKTRFFIDGNHLSVFEFQFILLSVAKLQTTFRCPVDFLILAICSVPQNEIINVLVYLQIVFPQGKRFRDNCKIYKALQLVESVKHKALLVLKLFQYDDVISYQQFYSLILMLQHANSGAEQLENIGMEEWINIATCQKWSEITGLIRKYGDVGYYLGILDEKGKKNEEEQMRKIFDSVRCIPKNMIALVTHFIENDEIIADEAYFENLKKVLMSGNDFIDNMTEIPKFPYLVTKENEQDQLMTEIYKNCPKDVWIFPDDTRSIDKIADLVFGIQDENEKENRKKETEYIARLLKILDEAKNSNIDEILKKMDNLKEKTKERLKILLEFDNALVEIKKKELRHTQKMAILYAVESDKHLLEQVNTGEGKSFIIAAIAIIRRKVDYRFVDIITSSPVLAERDSKEMKPLFEKFGLTVGHNCDENPEERKKNYQCDIVYGDIGRFQRDYLLHTFYKKELLGSRTRNCVIVDEVDNMLLDNGNNMLYLSHNIPGLNLLDSLLIFIHAQVYKPMYNGIEKDLDELQLSFDNEKIKEAVLTDIFGRLTLDDLKKLASIRMNQKEIESAFEKLVSKEIIDLDGYLMIHKVEEIEPVKELFTNDDVFRIRLENTLKIILSRKREIDLPNYLKSFVKLHLEEFIKNCKNSMFLTVDEEYVVDTTENSLDPNVIIIDSNTGVDLATSQWNGGLHQFLQLKHGCRLSPISLKAVFISNVAYLKGYEKINGLSGTLGSIHESKTLIDLYDAELIKIPTFKPRKFYEHVPVVSTEEDEWYQNIFDKVCDQVSVGRSVLIICESISTVQKINLELKNRYEKLKDPSDDIKKCFDSIVIYQREHEEFVFDTKNQLDTSRLIISTNLAGRGTDINLSEDLEKNGGLHVITSFLPANRRIEEQAFGRAARCGQPGSAQIIALHADDSGTKQSIFELKMFRDNQEVHRLASLKSYYDFHTEIEEKCLEKFREHCSAALNQVYSSSGANNEESLATPSQVVYFALLDKWALWLDEKSNLIDLCAKNRDKSEKDDIIESIQEFLNKHPFGSDKTYFEMAKEWIDAPQSLITIGVIQMCHDKGFKDAEDTFDKILMDGHEFAAEIYYYKACMRMKQWQIMRKELKSMKINQSRNYKKNLDEAMQFFQKSRTLFTERILKKEKEGKIIAQFSQNSNQTNNSGFSLQLKAIITAYQLIVDNIDWIIGRPINAKMFITNEISEDYAKKVFESFDRSGVVRPSVINNCKPEKWQLDVLRHIFKLSAKDVDHMLEGMKNDSRNEFYEKYNVFDKKIMMAHVKLPHRIAFLTELNQMKVFNRNLNNENETKISTVQQILVVDPSFESELPPELKLMKPVVMPNDDEILRYQIRLNNGKVQGIIYDWNDVLDLHLQNPEKDLIKKVEIMVSEKKITKDFVAQINSNIFFNIGYCQRFDGITISEVADYFQINELAADWILKTLTYYKILEAQTDLFYQFNPDEKIWNEKIGIFLEDKKKPNTLPNENFKICESDNLIKKNAEILESIRKISNLKNISSEIVQKFCKFDNNEKLNGFFKLLLKEQILLPYKLTMFRLIGKLDCSCLPPSISNEVLKFLNDRFAYSFAIQTLSYALDQSAFNPKFPKQILLPEDPHKNLEQELKRLGIILPPRICSNDYKLLYSKDYKHFEVFKSVIDENRTKIFNETQFHMKFGVSTEFFHSREHLMDVETKRIVQNGLPMLIMPKHVSVSWKISVKAVKFVGKCSRRIWRGIKAAGNFVYSFGELLVKTGIDKIVATSAYKTAVKVGQSINETVDAIANTEIYKQATETVKKSVSFVGHAFVKTKIFVENTSTKMLQSTEDAIVYVADKTIIAGANFIENSANKVGTAIASNTGIGAVSKIFQKIKKVVNCGLDMAKYTYQKMSAYVTASFESYEYYSECRLAAHQLAIEQKSLIDEQAILITFNNSMGEQNRKDVNDQKFLKKVEQHLVSESEKFVTKINTEIEKIVEKEFNNLIFYSEKDVETLLLTGEGSKRFKIDATEHFVVFASIAKVLFYQLIQNYAVDEKTNLMIIPISSYSLIPNYNCDELLETVQNICDEIKEFMKNNINTISKKKLNAQKLKKMLKTNLSKQLNFWALTIYIEPTIRIITQFLSDFRNKPQLSSMADFAENDRQLKMDLMDSNSSKQNKKNAKILKQSLFELLHQNLIDQLDNKLLFQVVFKYGYPLSINCAKKLADISHQVLAHGGLIDEKPEKGKKYENGFILQIFDSNHSDGRPLYSFKTSENAKIEVNITHVNGMIFLCQSDYQSYVETGELAPEESASTLSPFLYETLVKNLGIIKKWFPKQQESFREAIVHFS